MAALLPLEAWATWTAGVLLGVTLLYLLRPRRRRVAVAFGGLWQEVLAQADAQMLGRRWRRVLSWLLMMVLAALMLGAIGEQHLGLRGCSEPVKVQPRHLVVVLDASASMQTEDGAAPSDLLTHRSRLAAARERAIALIQAERLAYPGTVFLVLSASGRLRARCGWTDDTDVLTQAINRVEASDGGLDLQRALHAASDALIGRAQPQIVVVTDGGPAISPQLQPASAPVRYALVGPLRSVAGASTSSATSATSATSTTSTTSTTPQAPTSFDNLAVERVSVRARPGDASRGVLMARVRNDRAEAVVARVEIAASAEARTTADFQQDRAVRAVRSLRIAGHSRAWLRVDDLDLSVARFAVRVRPPESADWHDRAPWDDWAFAVLAERKRLGVLLVTAGNMFLEAAIIANDRYDVEVMTPKDFAQFTNNKGIIDVVVLDQVDANFPPGLPGMKFALAAPVGAAAQTLHDAGDLTVRDHGHPVMRGVVFHDANLNRVRTLATQAGDTILAGERGGGGVIVARDDEVRSLEIGFDLLETDLGARYALPVFMGNAIDWLAGEESSLLSPLVLGQPFSVQAPVRSPTWRWAAPGRPTVAARLSGGQFVGTTEAQGIHEWRTSAGQVVLRPTRLPQTERPGLMHLPKQLWTTPDPPKTPENPANSALSLLGPNAATTPAWAWFLLATLLLLVLEWALYHRRRTV